MVSLTTSIAQMCLFSCTVVYQMVFWYLIHFSQKPLRNWRKCFASFRVFFSPPNQQDITSHHWSEPSLSCINLLPYMVTPSALICHCYWHFIAQICLCHYTESAIQILTPLVQLQDLLDHGLIAPWGSLNLPALHQLQFDALWPSRFFLGMV